MFSVMDCFSIATLEHLADRCFLMGRVLRAMMVWRSGSPRSQRSQGIKNTPRRSGARLAGMSKQGRLNVILTRVGPGHWA
jgi:hypothetical protein